jgi:uncharacterized protein YjbI with pentapeptide repeats
MANKRHVARLKRGTAAWNPWREANPSIKPNLSGAHLTWMPPSEERLAQLAHLVQLEQQLQQALEAWTLWAVDADIKNIIEVGSRKIHLTLRPGPHRQTPSRWPAPRNILTLRFGPHRQEYTIERQEGHFGSIASGEVNLSIEPDLSMADSIKMARTQEHLAQLQQAVEAWGQSREVSPDLTAADLREADLRDADLGGLRLRGADLRDADLTNADLRGADLSGADLRNAGLPNADLRGADLTAAHLRGAYLRDADLREAHLSSAHLRDADLTNADLRGADLSGADLRRAHLTRADLAQAQLSGAKLQEVLLVETNFEGANLTGCNIYGISAWSVNLIGARQSDLIITPDGEPEITVDNLEVAQFIYLLLHNEKVREVIDTITSKAVLILGRFTPERKAVLDAIREALRHRNYLPILFDFERPTDRDFTETIMTLAGMCLFIIADITNPKSSPLELQATVPNYMVPFVPIIQEGEQPFSMFKDLRGKFDWVLDPLTYDSTLHLISGLEEAVIKPALMKHDELLAKKVVEIRNRHIRNYL